MVSPEPPEPLGMVSPEPRRLRTDCSTSEFARPSNTKTMADIAKAPSFAFLAGDGN